MILAHTSLEQPLAFVAGGLAQLKIALIPAKMTSYFF